MRSASPLLIAPLLIIATGCPGPGAASAPVVPSRPVVLTAPRAVALYEVRRPAALEGIEARVYALVVATASRFSRPVPATDEAACSAARLIARGTASSGPPPASLVDFAMRSEGLTDPPPHLVVATVPEGREGELLTQLSDRLERVLRQGSYLRAGIGVQLLPGLGERRLIVALFDGRVRFQPLPRELRLGKSTALEFELVSDQHQSLKLVVADPSGQIATEEPAPEERRYRARLSCRKPGVYQVEVTGDGPFGAEVLANFPVYCEQPAPTRVEYTPSPVDPRASATELERDLFERTNRVRRTSRVAALRYNPAVAQVARQHSEDMRDQQFVGHVSPRSGNPGDRLRRAAIVHLVARENVARAYSVEEAMTELMKSPAHRANLLAADVDEVGVGIVVERSGAAPVLLVTQNFIRAGTAYRAADGPAPAYAVIDERRRAGGLPALRRDTDLEKLAGGYVRSALTGDGQKSADAQLSAALKRFGSRFQQVEGVLIKLSALEGLAQASDLLKRGPTHVGVAVVAQPGQVVLFILLGTAR